MASERNLTDLYLTHKYGENEYNWHAQFGDLYPINGVLGEQRLLVSDYAALKFIFNDPTTFPRTASFRRVAWVLTGEGGLFHVNEDEHHRIRKVMNAAFSPHNIRDLVPLFQDIAMKVIDHLENSTALKNGTECLVDLYKTLQNATLDAVSQGALGYTLNAVGSEIPSDLVQAQYNALALASNRTSLSLIADSIIEYLLDISIKLAQYLPTSSCVALRHFRKQCEVFMEDLVHKKSEASQIGEKGKDILSVMSNKLKDVDLCNQSRSLLIAGQEATGGFLSWALYELAKNVAWQKQVRAELLQLRTKSGGQLTQADVELAQYLNAHLKETMRLHPSVPIVDRTASQDILLPLSQPISTKSGTKITEILIKKGQIIHCMISSFNRFNTVWGPDAENFDPLHWINKSRMLQGKPIGPYANM
ncbi:cytochrome P450 [Lentinula lateritia]|nr:cytochrome P450 [Lentinula lateritia]